MLKLSADGMTVHPGGKQPKLCDTVFNGQSADINHHPVSTLGMRGVPHKAEWHPKLEMAS